MLRGRALTPSSLLRLQKLDDIVKLDLLSGEDQVYSRPNRRLRRRLPIRREQRGSPLPRACVQGRARPCSSARPHPLAALTAPRRLRAFRIRVSFLILPASVRLSCIR